MVPLSEVSTHLESRQPEVEPAPLRIIKRSQTVTSRPSGYEFGSADEWGMFESTFENESEGSPPVAASRPLGPLTIHKTRRGRGSILDDSLSVDIVNIERKCSTPKVDDRDYRGPLEDDLFHTSVATHSSSQDTSTGKFLRTYSRLGNPGNEAKKHSIRSSDLQSNILGTPKTDGSPIIPKRKPSKSKYSLLRAFGGRRSEDSEPKHTLGRSGSSASTRSMKSHSTLLRKLSHRKSTASTIQSDASSVPSSLGAVELSHLFDSDGQDIINARINSGASSYYGGTVMMPSPSTPILTPMISSSRDDNCVLCPQISVTPESASVNAGVCTLWAAVEITGVLRSADGASPLNDASRTYSTQSLTPRCLDLRRYGSLHNIAVEFQPGPDCIIVDQPEDTFQSKTLRVSETHLMLVKIRLNEVKVSVSQEKDKSSDELIENINEILGDTTTQYLTVKLNYRHSAFLNLRQQAAGGDFRVLPQHTLLETKATATIKRHNPASAWSPRNSGALNSAVGKIGKFAADTLAYLDPTNNLLSHSFSMTAISNLNARGSPVSKRPSSPYDHPLDLVDGEMDPARKIWSQMRRTSRPARKHPRASISDGNYFSADQDTLFESTPRHRSSSRGTNLFLFEPPEASPPDTSLELTPKARQSRDSREKSPGTTTNDNRHHLMELALKNKRSVGQETLRSMVPSTYSGKGTGFGNRQGGVMGAVAGVGLAGRNWGQWLPWGG
ncbi:hypothetical protein EYC80_001248 [Monilinia laxa]|uniref:Uncharacterized protein n=1 Tax=Monilinia laxa TaxID=61186 RepID=A0A5N6K8V3_MONLA|nr:hypothetical protein EYC80_001248 [Monilinia laxa]